MTHRRSVNFSGYFTAGGMTKQTLYQPGTKDTANLKTGYPYYGGIIDLFVFSRLVADKNLQFFLEIGGVENPLTDLIALPTGINNRNLRESIPQARTAVPLKMSSDAILRVECLESFAAGEWFVVQGVADELGEDLTAV